MEVASSAVPRDEALVGGYVEIELDSSRLNSFQTDANFGELDQVILRFKFATGTTMDCPYDGKDLFDRRIGDVKKDHFSNEEGEMVTFVLNGTSLSDKERLIDLLDPS